MSVWKVPCFRDSIINVLSTFLEYTDVFKYPGFYNWYIDGDPKSPIPEFRQKYNVQKYIIDNNNDEKLYGLYLYLRNINNRPQSQNDWAFTAQVPYINLAKDHCSGLIAVYKVYHLIATNQLTFVTNLSHKDAYQMSQTIIDMQRGHTFNNYRGHDQAFKFGELDDTVTYLKDQADGIFQLTTYKRNAKWKAYCKAELKYIDYSEHVLQQQSKQQFRCGGLLDAQWIFDTKSEIFYILQNTDMQRISNMLRQMGQYQQYIIEDITFHRNVGDPSYGDPIYAMNSIVQNFMDLISKIHVDNYNDLAAVFSTAYDLYIAKTMKCVIVDSVKIQQLKIIEKGYDKYLDYSQHLGFVSGLPVSLATDLLHISKIFQCPDFDIFSALNKQQIKHESKYSIGFQGVTNMIEETLDIRGTIQERLGNQYDQIIVGGDLAAFAESALTKLKQISKYTLMKSLAKENQYWPGKIVEGYELENWVDQYLTNGIPDYTHVHKIDITGCMKYIEPFEETVLMAKDKTIEPEDENAAQDPVLLQQQPSTERNYLSYALSREMNAHISLRSTEVMREKQTVLVAFKPEAKKPDSRLFYIHKAQVRSVMSVFEDNISRVCSKQVGYVISKDPVAVQLLLTEMARFTKDIEHQTNTPLYISFDMKGWSPQLNWEIQEFYYDTFQSLFEVPELHNIKKAMKKMKVVLNTHGKSWSYDIDGTNLEGFNGKMLTKLHVDVMYTALTICQELGLVNQASYFGAFIDDGITCIPLNTIQYDEISKAVFGVVELVYSACGLRISYDKTFLSKIGAQFLNEVFLVGKRVQSGLKAYMKIGISKDLAAPTITDLQQAIFGTAQGAAKAGTETALCYKNYLSQATYVALKFNKTYADNVKLFALHFVTPIAMGGLGGKLLQSFDNTLQSSSTSENVALLLKLSKNDIECRYYFAHLSKKLNELRPLIGVVSSSSKVTMVQSRRLKNQLHPKLRKQVYDLMKSHPYFSQYIHFTQEKLVQLFQNSLGNHRTNVIELRDLYESQPSYLVDMFIGKFMMAQTVTNLLGQNTIAQCRRGHLRQPGKLWKFTVEFAPMVLGKDFQM